MALILPGGVNKGRRYVSLYESLTVNILKLAVIRAGVGGAGVNFEPFEYMLATSAKYFLASHRSILAAEPSYWISGRQGKSC